MRQKIRVWDLPTRLFHWTLVILFAFSWWSAEQREMEWHQWSGQAVLALLAFRILWGFIGSSTARFSSFVRSPSQVFSYVRSKDRAAPLGHNPLGGYSVLALLIILVTQVAAGLFAVDVDGIESGPLSFLVSFEAGRSAAFVHEVSFNLLLGLIVLHLLAVGYYTLIARQPLIRRMVTGTDDSQSEGTADVRPASPLRLVLALATAALLVWSIRNGLFL
jgi:cytochrome b